MKEHLADLLTQAIQSLIDAGTLPADTQADIHLENTRDKAHGDLATNLAMTLAKAARSNPRQLAEKICAALPASEQVIKAEIAGPGFINFFLNPDAIYTVVGDVLAQGKSFGRAAPNSGPRVQVEFVSANPTGPLHVGHGRGAAYGATVADLLEAAGLEIEREYYVKVWFSERSLTSSGDVDTALNILQDKGHLYEQDGNLWFRSTAFGDDKDRVVKRANGQTTYFASDIAYHMNKFDRGFDQVVNVWGADHHGYITRVKAAISALGYDPERLIVKLVQFAILYRGSERVQMSTRSGSFVTLRELRDEVGKDACRFFYVTRKAEQHMDFDLELAKSESKDNPIYYIQYAHARVCSVLRKLEADGLSWDQQTGLAALKLLDSDAEKDLITKLSRYPDVLRNAAFNYEPHLLANYLRELAGDYHTWYNGHKMLIEEADLRNARLTLSVAVRQVIANGLELLGASAPEQM